MGRRVSGDEGRHLIRHPPRGRSADATFSSRRRLWAGDGGKTPFPQGKALGAGEAEGEDGAAIFLSGDGLGIVIGHRGETLDALQHLVSLAARTKAGYYKITLNIGDYRERREDALVSLAKRIAAGVLKTGRGKALEPMNPYERRIIHTTIQEIEGVTSASLGEGENRRVVIVVEGDDVRNVRFDRRRSGDRGRNGRRPRRAAAPKITTPTREPKSDSDVPLYGKIK